MRIFVTHKRVGETPLQALQRLVKKQKPPGHWKFTYAGRLDPMAEGVLLVLANATQAQKEKYLSLPKTYRAEVLFGLGSDTADILGMGERGSGTVFNFNAAVHAAKKMIPEILLAVPRYSSVPVAGAPGFVHARAGKTVRMPKRRMTVQSVRVGKLRTVTPRQALQAIQKKIRLVQGDFRQQAILKRWDRLLRSSARPFPVLSLTIRCGSGTYIRSIAQHLGRAVRTKALLYSLVRTAVGTHKIKNAP